MSIGLAIIGNPRGDGFSEREAWETVEHEMKRLARTLGEGEYVRADRMQGTVKSLLLLARAMRSQVERGMHVNPRRNPGRGQIMSEGVQAIVYVHKDDGEFYIHPFGGTEASDRDLALLARMQCFTRRSRVRMIAEPDGSVTVEGKDGQNLWKEF